MSQDDWQQKPLTIQMFADDMPIRNTAPLASKTPVASGTPVTSGTPVASGTPVTSGNDLEKKIAITLAPDESADKGPKLLFESDLGGGIVIEPENSKRPNLDEQEQERRLVASFRQNTAGAWSQNTKLEWMNLFSEAMTWLLTQGLEALQIKCNVPVKEDAKDCNQFFGALESSRLRGEASLSAAENKILALRASEDSLKTQFDETSRKMYQRFSPTDDTIYYLEAVTHSLKAQNEWNRVWRDISLAKSQDLRSAFQRAITGVSMSIRGILQASEYHCKLISQEHDEYAKSIASIAPKKKTKESNHMTEQAPAIRDFQQKYLEFLGNMLGSDIVPQETVQASVDLLRRCGESLETMQIILQDIQEQLDRAALNAPSDTEDPGKQWNQKREQYEANQTQTQLESDTQGRLRYELDQINKRLLESWSRGQWVDLQSLKEQRERMEAELRGIDDRLRMLSGDAGALIRSLTKLTSQKRSSDAAKLATEHRYTHLNRLLKLLSTKQKQHNSEKDGTTQLYYRAQDMLREETSKVFEVLREIATAQMYSSGIRWAEEFSGMAREIHCRGNQLEHYLKSQKEQLDATFSEYKRALIMRSTSGRAFETIHMDINRLQSLSAQYAATAKECLDATVIREDARALKELKTILCRAN